MTTLVKAPSRDHFEVEPMSAADARRFIRHASEHWRHTMLDRVLRRANIDRSRVHDLRHTCATLVLEDGATIREVMEQLGHASITTTADIYGHVLDRRSSRWPSG